GIDKDMIRRSELLKVPGELMVTVHHRHNLIMELSKLLVTPVNRYNSAFLRMLRGCDFELAKAIMKTINDLRMLRRA
nr:hypothetical protein [Tanacetum cinerariifolium]